MQTQWQNTHSFVVFKTDENRVKFTSDGMISYGNDQTCKLTPNRRSYSLARNKLEKRVFCVGQHPSLGRFCESFPGARIVSTAVCGVANNTGQVHFVYVVVRANHRVRRKGLVSGGCRPIVRHHVAHRSRHDDEINTRFDG